MSRKITLLDLGGVVFNATGASNDQINWEVITKLNHQYGHNLNIGLDQFPDFMADYNKMTQQHLNGAAFLKAVFDTLDFNSELVEMVGANRDIIIVSDNYRENIEYISKRYHFTSWASQEIYSFDYKMEKSNPAFFKILLEGLGDYDLEEMIFIDDSPHKIKSAAGHGIKGILFKNNQQVRKELEELKII